MVGCIEHALAEDMVECILADVGWAVAWLSLAWRFVWNGRWEGECWVDRLLTYNWMRCAFWRGHRVLDEGDIPWLTDGGFGFYLLFGLLAPL